MICIFRERRVAKTKISHVQTACMLNHTTEMPITPPHNQILSALP